jgi:hypothetical protein
MPSFSPDVSAAFSYLILTVIGALVARRKIIQRFSFGGGSGDYVPVWHYPTTYLLASVYIVIPVLLFWMLDKTGAISDTSLFAAIIVAFSYDQIIAGKDPKTKTPTGGATLLNPLRWAEQISQRVTYRQARTRERIYRRISRLAAKNPDVRNKLHALAAYWSDDETKLAQALQKEESRRTSTVSELVDERKAMLLLNAIVSAPECPASNAGLLRALANHQVLSRGRAILWSPVWGSKLVSFVVILVLPIVAIGALWLSFQNQGALSVYYHWRLSKDTMTQAEAYRLQRNLSYLLNTSVVDTPGPPLPGVIFGVLRSPLTTSQRADYLIGILLESKCGLAANGVHLQQELVASLRTTNLATRDRIHRTLLALTAPDRPVTAAADPLLADWKAADPITPEELDAHVSAWRAYWDRTNDWKQGLRCSR